ncbi:cobalamin biosynthesis protein [Janibacter hoylei]|uniref:cobalamin biosynthesis protein n=1 Tax=Janibacter hoylei TaxID=364298 RepID=UPI002238EBFE|nr:cobalamin biosynthesis protein [Janibacter hoylei]MCW4602756.1 cobalamin biosynthesis protein [Janibacter hoylei]
MTHASRVDAVSLGLALGWVADLALGDPRRGHPVALFGTWAGWVEARTHRNSRAAGIATEALALAPVVALGVAAGRLTGPRPPSPPRHSPGQPWAARASGAKAGPSTTCSPPTT